MELRVNLSDPVEIRLAVEFMGKVAVHRDQEGCFHASSAQVAKEVLAKAKSEPAPAPVVAEEVLETVSAEPEIAVRDLVQLASAKSKTVGAPKVKEIISMFGATSIKDVEPSRFVELKSALEAL